jgi:hypothetical protein
MVSLPSAKGSNRKIYHSGGGSSGSQLEETVVLLLPVQEMQVTEVAVEEQLVMSPSTSH